MRRGPGPAGSQGGRSTREVIPMEPWVSPHALSLVLDYMYTGQIDDLAVRSTTRLAATKHDAHAHGDDADGEDARMDSEDTAYVETLLTILRLADLFELDHLKEVMESRLAPFASTNASNAAAITSHALACQAQQLYALGIHFLRLNHPVLRGTEMWEELPESIKEDTLR